MVQPSLRLIAMLIALLCAWQPAAAQPHKPSTACATYFHVATFDRDDIRWNAPTSHMQNWWTRKAVPGLCYTSDPQAADYVLVWRAETITIRQYYSLEVPVPIGLDTPVPVRPIVGSAASSIPSTRKERRVTVAVYSRGAADAALDLVWREPTFSVSKTSNWPWSKPDRDALAEAITRLNPSHRPGR